jgi:hypothetical protein
MPTLFEVQLDMLKVEIQAIDETIARMDEITKNVKQWAIALWTVSVGGAMKDPALAPYVGATAAVPLLFWLVDTWHRRIQRKFIWRTTQISTFLNDGGLEQSIAAGRFVGEFKLLDPASRTNRTKDYYAFIDYRGVMAFPSMLILYLGMIVLSFALAVMVGLHP